MSNDGYQRAPRPDRPGGITVLAMVTALDVFARLFSLALILRVSRFSDSIPAHAPAEIRGLAEIVSEMPEWAISVALSLNGLAALTALIAVFGLWKMHPIWGRWGATFHGIVSAAAILHWAYNGPDHPRFDGGFTVGTIANLFGPIFLISFINTIFAVDFRRHHGDEGSNPDALEPVKNPEAQPGFIGHLFEIARETYRSSLRSATGLAFLLITIFIGLGTAHSLLLPLELIQSRVESFAGRGMRAETMEEFTQEFVEEIKDVLIYMMVEMRYEKGEEGYAERKEAAEEWGDYLAIERPHVLSAFHLIMLLIVPFLISSGVFNLFAEDAKERRLRFFLMRTTRLRLLLGRLIGAYLLVATALIPIFAAVGLYMAANVSGFEPRNVVVWSSMGLIAALFMALPYVVLAAVISASLDSPWASLAILTGLVGILPVVALIGAGYWGPLGNFIYWLPWWVQFKLLHPDIGTALFAGAMCLGYTAAYLGLGYWNFKYRDV